MYTEIFHNRLKYTREKKGLTQDEIARELNISQPTYANYEMGRRIPDMEKLAKIADILNVTLDWLIGRDNPQPFKQ